MLLNVSQKTAHNKDKCQFSMMCVIHISWHPIVELVAAGCVREPSFQGLIDSKYFGNCPHPNPDVLWKNKIPVP